MTRASRIAALFFAAVPATVLVAAVAATYAISRGTEWLRAPFRVLCHGLASRSLALFDVTMPLCARCTGIYAGLLAGLAAFFVLPRLSERVMRITTIVAVFPMGIDGVTQALGLRESTNALRLATGFAAAFAFGLWALSAVEHREPQSFTAS